MDRAFDVIASFHDEETSLAIKCITTCILYIYIIGHTNMNDRWSLGLETMGLGLEYLGLEAPSLESSLVLAYVRDFTVVLRIAMVTRFSWYTGTQLQMQLFSDVV